MLQDVRAVAIDKDFLELAVYLCLIDVCLPFTILAWFVPLNID